MIDLTTKAVFATLPIPAQPTGISLYRTSR